MFRKLSRKHLSAVAFVAALAITGAAVAYFTGGSVSVNGAGKVGAPTPWAVALGTPTWSGTLTALYPGATSDTELIPFTVTNNGQGPQSVTKITASLPAETNGDAESAGGVDIPSCRASWFSAVADTGNPALPSNLAPGGTYAGKIDLTMTNANTNQNACQNAAPEVTITAS